MMSPSPVRRGLLAALLFAAALGACKCGDKTQVAGCSSDADCQAQHGGDTRWTCDKSQNPALCVEQPRGCDTAADCCPAQICKSAGHFCIDSYTICSGPGSCAQPGQVCKNIGVFSQGLGCTFEKCDASGGCADPQTTCFNHYCVGSPPCSGGGSTGCGTGKVCVTATDLCSPAPKDASCQRTCPTGQILVLTNPDNIFDSCNPASETCECDSLPPLISHDLGRHSSAVVSGNDLVVSSYDGQYGDLVVMTFDKNTAATTGKPTKAEWLDGVPDSGTIRGDTNGPRHGIINPGPNVGQYTSITADPAGNLYVSYYDVDNGGTPTGNLKFIARYGGVWTQPMIVDGADASGNPTGDVGLYSSIAIDSQGRPAIAYFRRGNFDATANAETGVSTALLYAVAKSSQPKSRSDWVVLPEVDKMDKPLPPCGAGCPSGQLCVDEGGGQSRCAKPAPSTPGCVPGCVGNQACVVSADGTSAVCRSSLAASTLFDLPQGVGVTPSLAFLDDKPVIAYYDSVHKLLKAVAGNSTGITPNFGTPVVLDGGDPAPAQQRDVGRFPSIAVGKSGQLGGRVAIAYQDVTNSTLLLYQSDLPFTAHAPHGSAGIIHVVDNGLPNQDDPNEAWHPQSTPGAQSSTAFTPSGKIAIAYQDATPVDLRLATYDPSARTAARTTLRSTGAAGFWPHIALDGSQAYVTSALIKAATAQLSGNRLVIDTKATP